LAKRFGDKLELLLAERLRVAHEAGRLRDQDLKRVTVDVSAQGLSSMVAGAHRTR
jgi:transposase, IS5 family